LSDLIDLHIHIFNVLFLPIKGIAVKWCRDHRVPESVGKRAADLLNTIAHSHSGSFAADDSAARKEALRVDALLTEAETARRQDDVLLNDMAVRLPDSALAGEELFEVFAKTEGASLRSRKCGLVKDVLDMDAYYPSGCSEYDFFTVPVDRMLRVQKATARGCAHLWRTRPTRENEIEKIEYRVEGRLCRREVLSAKRIRADRQ